MSDAALIITAINAALVLLAIVALVLIFWRRDRGAERPQGDAAHADQATTSVYAAPTSEPTTPHGLPVLDTAATTVSTPPSGTPATAAPGAPWTSPLAYRDPAVESTVDISRLGIEASVDLSTRVLAELGYRYDPRNRTLDFIGPDLSTVTIQARTPSTLTLIGHGHVIPYLAYRIVEASTDIDPVVASMPVRGSNGH